MDEAGRFQIHVKLPGNVNYELMIALVIPETLEKELEEKFAKYSKEELRKMHAQEIIEVLAKGNAKAFIVLYDANNCDQERVTKMREDYLKSIFQNKNHPEWLKDSILKQAKILSECDPVEFIKSFFFITLFENCLRGILENSNEFCSSDLAPVTIFCDNLTPSIMSILKSFPYYAMYCSSTTAPLNIDNVDNIKDFIHSNGSYFDATRFIKDINFIKSNDSVGIKIVDVVANQVYRLFRDQIINCDLLILSKLFCGTYSFVPIHLNIDLPHIDSHICDNAKSFVKYITKHQ